MYFASIVFLLICVSSLSQSFTLYDLLPADSESKEVVNGGDKEHHSAHKSSSGEKGEKGYAAYNEKAQGAKGHHDKEGHKGHYAEEDGNKNSRQHDDSYYSEHEKGENGEKGFNFVDKGSYAKGHSTKGGHVIHDLDEYKKDTEFYDEDHDEAYKEKHAGYEIEQENSSGDFKKRGHAELAYNQGGFGQQGQAEKGSYYDQASGHKNIGGLDKYQEFAEKFAKEGGNNEFNKWGFKH